MDRLETLYQAETEEESLKGKYTGDEVELLGAECKDAILWKDVHFSYSAEREVLKGISFQIKKGQMVAFAGGSGEGKSTIARLLYGLYRKESGSYQLFGKDVEQWSLREWRDCFSVVSQNVFLLPQSVAENVACGKEGAAREEIEEACRAADIHDFIMSLPQGYDTQVGELGVKLSGGQRQRISIARAFLKNAPILLLDEPTSAIDTETEAEIQKAITRVARDKTVIVMAHRLSTIQNADCIYVVENGAIAESGTHRELLARNGIYAGLYGKEVGVDER